MDTSELFEAWRALGRHRNEWGLAWFLAFQFCRRFYASHGIVPHVINKEGLGYYGIQLDYVPCKVNKIGKLTETLGRMTAAGDVENWRIGGPGDHGLKTSEHYKKDVPTGRLVSLAFAHIGLPTLPSQRHTNCRHKRWGRSYELMFEIATILALRNSENLQIWNHSDSTEKLIRELDPKASMDEHPGAFVFESDTNRVVITGAGRLLDESDKNFWEDYMRGNSPFFLATCIEEILS